MPIYNSGLMLAIMNSQRGIVSLLLSHPVVKKVDVTIENAKGETAYDLAQAYDKSGRTANLLQARLSLV